MRLAFAGFRHPHILSLYRDACRAPNVEIVGCFEEDAEVRASLALMEGVICTYPTYEALLEDPRVDAVAVGDWYGVRGSRLIGALRHGKHVLCDKPLCTRLSELDEIGRLAEENHLLVGCMLDLRYLPQVETAKDILRSGQLGSVRSVSFSGQHPLNEDTRPSWYFEDGKHGGTINDLAVHGIDLVRCLTGANLTEIDYVKTWNAFAKRTPQFHDCAQFMAQMGSVALTGDVSYSAPACGYDMPTYWDFQFWCDRGMLRFHYTDPHIFLYRDTETVLDCPVRPFNMAEDFARELSGEETPLGMQSCLVSTRQTLELQQRADACGRKVTD